MDPRIVILELAGIPDPDVSVHEMRARIGRWTASAQSVIARPDQTSDPVQKPWVWLYERMLEQMGDDPKIGCAGLLWLDYWLNQLSPELSELDLAEMALRRTVDDDLRSGIARLGVLSAMSFESQQVVLHLGDASIPAGFLESRGYALQNLS